VRADPELIFPDALTVMVLVEGTTVEEFRARMPSLPELMTSPLDVETETFPVPLVFAKMP
jgi:hypothetical protein